MNFVSYRVLSLALIFSALLFAQTPPPQAAGYHMAFSDSFDQLSLSPDGYGAYTWYPSLPWVAQTPMPSLITANDSILNLTWATTAGMNDTTVTTMAKDGSSYHAYRYGYFEARMAWDATTGAWPAFWLLPIQTLLSNAPQGGEIDIFEGQGIAPHTFSAAVHVWNAAGTVQTFQNGCDCNLAANNNFAAWHKYGLLWTPGKMTWYYDDQEVYSTKVPAIFDQQNYYLILGSQEGANWTYGNLQGVTANSMTLSVDWVHVWQSPSTTARRVH